MENVNIGATLIGVIILDGDGGKGSVVHSQHVNAVVIHRKSGKSFNNIKL